MEHLIEHCAVTFQEQKEESTTNLLKDPIWMENPIPLATDSQHRRVSRDDAYQPDDDDDSHDDDDDDDDYNPLPKTGGRKNRYCWFLGRRNRYCWLLGYCHCWLLGRRNLY